MNLEKNNDGKKPSNVRVVVILLGFVVMFVAIVAYEVMTKK